MHKVEKGCDVLAESKGGFTVSPKYFGSFTVFGTPYDSYIEEQYWLLYRVSKKKVRHLEGCGIKIM